MHSNDFWDRRATSVVLGLFTTIAAIYKITLALRAMTATVPRPEDADAILVFMGSIAPLLIGFAVTSFAAIPGKLEHITWHNINNMFAGLLGGYGMYLLGISSYFASSVTNTIAGGIIAGIGTTLAAAALIKWP